MALKALMLRKKIDMKKSELEGLRNKSTDLQTREAELETAIGEVTSEEETAAVDAEIEALTADREANNTAIADLEGEIAEMEQELAVEEQKQNRSTPAPAAPENNRQREEAHIMPVREKMFFGMNIMERHAFFEDQGVKDFLSAVRSMRGNVQTRTAGNIVNGEVLIPEVMLPLLHQIVEENSKLMKHVYAPQIPGTARLRVDGGFPEAVWTEMYGRLNELEITYNDVELDGYKVGGIVRIPNALIEDSDINLASEIITKLGRGIGYAYDKAVLYGTGSNMPLGIVTRLAQTSAPSNYSSTARAWVDLHSANIKTISASNTGLALFQQILLAFNCTKNSFSRGGKFWAMNDGTYNTLLVQAMSINANGAIVSGIDLNNKTMPVIGGAVEILDFIPDNVIIAGYDGLYIMGERKDVQFGQSEHVYFADDQTAFKGTARYDGKPVVAEAFAAIGINGVTPSDSMTFTSDVANTVQAITMTATASVKVGKTISLTAVQTPEVGANVKWTTSSSAVATVSNGTVTGVSAGTATITATVGTVTAVCTVTVTA